MIYASTVSYFFYKYTEVQPKMGPKSIKDTLELIQIQRKD